MMETAKQLNLPRAIIVNKIDSVDLVSRSWSGKIQPAFGPECLPINLPAGKGKAVVECLLNTGGESDYSTVKAGAHTAILDQIVEMDENLMEKYLGGEEPNYEALHAPFERAMDGEHLIPILFYRYANR